MQENLFSCSQDAQDQLADVIKEKNLNRVVVAACTPRTHEPLFQETLESAGLNKYLFEMANIRNQCSWVHSNDPEEATQKAIDQVRMAVAKAGLLAPLSEHELTLNSKALVVGGGLAGISAALSLAEQGLSCYLVEKSDQLGGNARNLRMTAGGQDVQARLAGLIDRVQNEELVEVLTGCEITSVEGFVGNFNTTLSVGGQEKTLEHGVAILATGATEYQPEGYLFGQDPRVFTGMSFQRHMLEGNEPGPGPVVFVQCVGSRIPERPWCSKVCCTQSVMKAIELKEKDPSRPVFVLYRQMRTYGLREALYRKARDLGVVFTRYEHDKPFEVKADEQSLTIEYHDGVLDRRLGLKAGTLVLAAATIPPDNQQLSQLLKVTVNQDGFFQEAHAKLRPVEFATDGVFVCGLAHSPMPVEESISQAQAASAKAASLLNSASIMVGGVVSKIDESKCVGCGVCPQVCPYQAISMNEKNKAEVNPATCKGCGVCVASCRSGAPNLLGFTEGAILAQIEEMY